MTFTTSPLLGVREGLHHLWQSRCITPISGFERPCISFVSVHVVFCVWGKTLQVRAMQMLRGRGGRKPLLAAAAPHRAPRGNLKAHWRCCGRWCSVRNSRLRNSWPFLSSALSGTSVYHPPSAWNVGGLGERTLYQTVREVLSGNTDYRIDLYVNVRVCVREREREREWKRN